MSKNHIIFSVLALGVSGLLAGLVSAGKPADVPYPSGYRNWTHVKSMVIQPGHPLADPFLGIHHVYANDKALQGLKSGNYADGAVLVFDLLNYQDGGKVLTEAERKLVGVMQRDAQKFATTGGWGFDGFAGDSKSQRLVTDGGAGCYACHTQVKDRQFVFSELRT